MRIASFIALASLLALSPIHGETIVLKNGKRITGKLISTEGAYVSLTSDGINMSIEKSQIASIEMSDTPSAATPTTPAPAPAMAPVGAPAALPAGTPIIVTLGQSLSSSSARPGQTFSATVVSDVRSGGTIVIPAGSPAQGVVSSANKAGRGVRKTPGSLTLELTSVTVNGRILQVATASQQASGEQQKGSLVKGAAKGAIAGSITGAIRGDAGEGAAGGAAAGAALGFVKPGEELGFQMGSVLSFSLRAPAGP